jgi:hypothetical protein
MARKTARNGEQREPHPYEEEIYDEAFPKGDDEGFGIEQGFNRFVRINDPKLFTAAAKRDKTVQAFLEAPFSVNYAQFKSSHRESEWYIHKPHRVMAGEIDRIEGVEGFPQDPNIVTLVLNHHMTLARFITRSVSVVDEEGKTVGKIDHKEDNGSL